jgi:NDP-sugar pyrophosphorylase family protein
MQTVAVLAGGLGLRLRAITGETLPKALVPVLGRPFVDWKLAGLASAGATRVVLLVGHQGDRIRDHVGDGKQFGLDIAYVDDGPSLLGTGGALLKALPSLPETFWATYCDTLLDVDLKRAEAAFAQARLPALMTVLRNRNSWEPSNVRVAKGRVAAYGKRPTPLGAEHIDYGMLAFDHDAWDGWTGAEAFDLEELLRSLIAQRGVAAFEVSERFHDIGSPDAVRETEDFLRHRLTAT